MTLMDRGHIRFLFVKTSFAHKRPNFFPLLGLFRHFSVEQLNGGKAGKP